jgi:hypothetical protein
MTMSRDKAGLINVKKLSPLSPYLASSNASFYP